MKSKLAILAALVMATAVILPSARGHEEIFTAVLNGASEHPANGSTGSGFATVTLDLDLFTLRVQTSFSDLQGVTSAAHIHAPTAEPFTGVADVATQTPSFTGFPTGVYSGSYDHTFDLADSSSYNPDFIAANGGTVSGASNALIFAMQDGKAYLNIHTTAFPGGEIRGFLAQVPEPGTIALLFAGAAALLIRQRFSRR
ncbi:MAG TPA: CHRD domain-containing protein [Chthoniobacterales bacterium]|nr:CHRD domain-containing protein [Chthoniobacterales bacterium]